MEFDYQGIDAHRWKDTLIEAILQSCCLWVLKHVNPSRENSYFHFYTVQELRFKSKNSQLLAPVSIVFRHTILKRIHTH